MGTVDLPPLPDLSRLANPKQCILQYVEDNGSRGDTATILRNMYDILDDADNKLTGLFAYLDGGEAYEDANIDS